MATIVTQEIFMQATSGEAGSLQQNCVWGELFCESHRNYLNDSLVLAGTFASAATTWLLYNWSTLQLKNHVNEYSYRNLFHYVVAMHLRLIIPFTIDCLKNYVDFWFLPKRLCAFVETFLQVLEIEALTHLCIERYVYAKYITNGLRINKNHYTLYIYLCFMFAGLYSILPIYGIGDYSFDFDCNRYTMDMVLPNSWKRYVIVAIFVLKSIKPTVFMVAMLSWARQLEKKYTAQMKKRGDLHYTQLVIKIVMWNHGMWMPMAFTRGFVLVTQLLWGEMKVLHPDSIRWAFWMYEVSPLCVTALILMEDGHEKNRASVRFSNNDETGTELKED